MSRSGWVGQEFVGNFGSPGGGSQRIQLNTGFAI